MEQYIWIYKFLLVKKEEQKNKHTSQTTQMRINPHLKHSHVYLAQECILTATAEMALHMMMELFDVVVKKERNFIVR